MVINQTFDALAFERLIARLMLIGARISEVCLVCGLVLWMFGSDAMGGQLLRVGLVALMAMPALRIVLTVVESLRLKDWVFVASTVTVATILSATIVYAFTLG